MCRNITTLRGLEPAATSEEIEAAAAQFVRKVTGVAPTAADSSRIPCEEATAEIAGIITRLLDELPARRNPPKSLPPLRRASVSPSPLRGREVPPGDVAERMRLREEHEKMHELGIPHTH